MLVVTDSAVRRIRADGADEASARPFFRGEGIVRAAEGTETAIVALKDGGVLAVGENGAAERLARLDEPMESLLILRDSALEALVGTEGARLHRIAGAGAERIEAFDRLECRGRWHTPWGGPPAVRSLAATPDGTVYADIHVGGIMRSMDEGHSWEPVKDELNEDVHQVAACPAAPDRVVANTARGVYVSDDRGLSWRHRAEDLGERYGRAVAVAPDEPDLMLATVSDGPHGDDVHGQLYRTEDAGQSWRHVADGFPAATKSNINTHHVAFSSDGTAWACVGTRLYRGSDRGRKWSEVWRAPREIVMLSTSSGMMGK